MLQDVICPTLSIEDDIEMEARKVTRIEVIIKHAVKHEHISEREAHAIMAAMLFTQKRLADVRFDYQYFLSQYGTLGMDSFEDLFRHI